MLGNNQKVLIISNEIDSISVNRIEIEWKFAIVVPSLTSTGTVFKIVRDSLLCVLNYLLYYLL